MGGELWDAIVVGAGPAGAAAAYDLAAAGCRVLLADRAAFPRAKACAGGLTMKAVRALRYPIDPVVRRWVSELVLEEAPSRMVTTARRKPVCAMTVREELDAFCLGKTVARGAKFRRIGPIAAVEQREDRMVLRFADAGQEETLEARFLLGADGVHSRVRALAGDGARWFRRGFAVEANVPYRDGEAVPPLLFDFAPIAGGYGWLFPRDNHVNVGLYIADSTAGASGSLNRAALERYIAARCGAGREAGPTVGQFLGLGAVGYQPREDARVLLAGDAAGFADPLTGEGIYGAIRSGQAAAEAILGALALEADKGRDRRSRKTAPGSLTGAHRAVRPLADGFRAATRGLRNDLEIAEYAAKRFYGEPAHGFHLMRLPLLPRAALKVYSDGLPLRALLTAARMAGHLLPAAVDARR